MASIYDLYLDIIESLPKSKLIEACEDDEIEKVKKFLKYKFIFPVNGKGDLGTPLTRSISPEMITLLIRNGARVNKIVRDSEIQHGRKRIDEHTALCSYNAIAHGHEIIECLLLNNANPNITLRDNNINGQTPLFFIINKGESYASYHREDNLKKIELLIEYGADVNKQDENGDTPLTSFLKNEFSYSHFTGKEYKMEIVNLLITKGADINLHNKHGETALSIAKERGFSDIEKLLLREGGQAQDIMQSKSEPERTIKLKKKIKNSQLQCDKCFETYNFRTFAGIMTDEKVASIFSKSGIPVINQGTKLAPDLVNKKYSFASRVFRYLGNGKGVPTHVRNCFKRGISRRWSCEKCQNINEYPEGFVKYWGKL